jgi:hypothetical protein
MLETTTAVPSRARPATAPATTAGLLSLDTDSSLACKKAREGEREREGESVCV